MSYDKAALVRFALEAEAMSQGLRTFGGSVEVNTIADALGMSHEDGFGVANYLADLGWARVTHANPVTLVLTPLGYEEIAKLKRPKWRQWIDLHLSTIATGVIAGIVSGLIVAWLMK